MTLPQIIIVSFAVGVLAFLATVLNDLRKHEPELSRLQVEPLPFPELLPFSEEPEPLFPAWYDVQLEAELILEASWKK